MVSMVVNHQAYLRPLCRMERLVIPATSGLRTIAKEDKKVFAMVHFDFGGLDFSSPPTLEAELSINEVSRNGNSRQVLADFPSLNDLCLTQDQIIQVIIKYALKLHPRGNSYFFFTRGGERVNSNQSNLFVARVLKLTYGFYVFPDPFSFDDRWKASSQARIVTLKLR